MKLFSTQPVIAVHDGKFHADDIFACAVLQVLLRDRAKIIRTRDEQMIAAADYVVDVGNINDPEKNRFDHHMPEGGGVRENGIPYAAFGLTWRKYGEKIAGSAEIAERIDQKLAEPIDAEDNGVYINVPEGDTMPYTLQNFLYMYRPTWKENDSDYDKAFPKLVALAKEILLREIVIVRDSVSARDIAEKAYRDSLDKRIILLPISCPYEETLSSHIDPTFVVAPRRGSTNWGVGLIPLGPKTFEKRKLLPEAWAGLRDSELAKITGVADAVFCHRGLFLAVAKSKEGALALAKLALEL